VEPPLSQWLLADRPATARDALRSVVKARASRLGGSALGAGRSIVATGHQPFLWHPGILAKDVAMRRGGERLGAEPLHLVVDHDVRAALSLDVPVRDGESLWAERVQLAPMWHQVPAGFQPAADASVVVDTLKEQQARSAVSLDSLIAAFSDLPGCDTLAEQQAVVLARLKAPFVEPPATLMVRDLAHLPAYARLVAQIRADARRCALSYNRSVSRVPAAGVTPLLVTPEWVEAPLWACAWQRPRRRVFVDVSAAPAMFVLSDGTPIDEHSYELLPRALPLTAVMRQSVCDFFIHGRGGGVYDRITDRWWHAWQNAALAPTAVVSADAQLTFDVPIADRGEYAAARWWWHHVRHNVDRVLGLDGPLTREKRRLIEIMDVDRDRWRRWLRFRAIHRINDTLARQHSEPITSARDALRRAGQGLTNREAARKRDWCFALHERDALASLFASLASPVDQAR